MENYYHRKLKHVSILEAQLQAARNRLKLAEIETGRVTNLVPSDGKLILGEVF